MRRWIVALTLGFGLVTGVHGAEGHVFKVLPQYLDAQGRDSLSPSLYDRDAYQADLQRHPVKRAAMRFAVDWKISRARSNARKLRVELRGPVKGDAPAMLTLELPLKEHAFSHWDYVILPAEKYQAFGDVTAWRVTLWDGDTMLDEQKSFLW